MHALFKRKTRGKKLRNTWFQNLERNGNWKILKKTSEQKNYLQISKIRRLGQLHSLFLLLVKLFGNPGVIGFCGTKKNESQHNTTTFHLFDNITSTSTEITIQHLPNTQNSTKKSKETGHPENTNISHKREKTPDHGNLLRS